MPSIIETLCGTQRGGSYIIHPAGMMPRMTMKEAVTGQYGLIRHKFGSLAGQERFVRKHLLLDDTALLRYSDGPTVQNKVDG